MAELVDIYSRDRQKTGKVVERGTFLQPDEYRMFVLAMIERPDHTFLVTQRVMTKHWAAGQFEVSGGGAKSGETSWDAVKREVAEEVGLDVEQSLAQPGKDFHKPVYTYFNDDPARGDNYFVDIYHFHMDIRKEDVTIQPEEVLGFRFASPQEIRLMAESDLFLHFRRLNEALQKEGEPIW